MTKTIKYVKEEKEEEKEKSLQIQKEDQVIF